MVDELVGQNPPMTCSLRGFVYLNVSVSCTPTDSPNALVVDPASSKVLDGKQTVVVEDGKIVSVKKTQDGDAGQGGEGHRGLIFYARTVRSRY